MIPLTFIVQLSVNLELIMKTISAATSTQILLRPRVLWRKSVWWPCGKTTLERKDGIGTEPHEMYLSCGMDVNTGSSNLQVLA
jgi:hypothetical protein